MFYFDNTMILPIIGGIICVIAQMGISRTYEVYKNKKTIEGRTGEQVALILLQKSNIKDVTVEMVKGKLSDHYDPTKKVVRLSQDIFSGTSIAAVSIAAHEVGHAIQHNKSYAMLTFRSALAPLANFSSKLSWVLIAVGILISYFSNLPIIFEIGIILFSVVVIFQIITLPVEFNASSRALKLLGINQLLNKEEMQGSRKMLKAAALTYVAATISGILQLIRLLLILNRNRD